MSKKFLLLLLLFLLLVATCIGVFFFINNSQTKTVKTFFNQKTSSKPQATTTLSLVPVDAQTIHVILTTSAEPENAPRLVQLEVGYNVFALTNVTLLPGDFFSEPTVLLNTNDIKTGRISYALTVGENQTTYKTTGTVVIMKFTPLIDTQTTVSLLPKTTVRSKGSDNILTSKTGITLLFNASLSPATSSAKRGL
jgi:hypothetical protein